MENTDSITREILGLEKKYWKAMQEHDLETALSLTDFPCVVAGAHGAQSVNRQQFADMFNSQDQATIRSVEFDEENSHCRLVAPSIAIVAYQIQTKFTHEGEEKDMSAVDTSTWIKRNGRWVCAMHTETELLKH